MTKIILLEEETFKEVLLKIDRIETLLADKQNKLNQSSWITNEDACKFLNVTSRTMQKYRDEGILSYSKVGSLIYYKQSDLDNHLVSHYRSGFKKERRSA